MSGRRVRLFLVALTFWAVTASLPPPAMASRAADDAFAAEVSEVLAANETELVRLRAALDFLRERLESSHADEVLLLLDDPLVREALLERAEAELADARMAQTYLDQHPRRVGALARVAAAGQTVDRGVRMEMESREMSVEVLEAQQVALLAAVEERGLAPDKGALEIALHLGIAELEVARIGLQVEVDQYRNLREIGDDERLVLLLPETVVLPARHLQRQWLAAKDEEARQAQVYGDKHPSQVDTQADIARIETQLDASLDLAVRAEVTRLKLLWAQQQALEARLAELGEGP